MTETPVWDGIYKSRGSGLTLTNWLYSFNKLFRIASNLLSDVENPFIVSDGCGEGKFEIKLAKNTNGNIIGIDHSSVAIEHSRQSVMEAKVSNIFFVQGLIEDYLHRKNFYNRDLSLAINSYQYFINKPTEPNTRALKMFRSLMDNIRKGGYVLLTGPSLEGYGKEFVSESIDYTEPLACYRSRDSKGKIVHQETFFGERFKKAVRSDEFSDVKLIECGELPFDARDLFPIADLAERMGSPSIANHFRSKGRHYKEIQDSDPSKGPMLDWYVFQRL
jgi:precorrin-6B methylase 2